MKFAQCDNKLFLWGTKKVSSKVPLIALLFSKKYPCLIYKPFGYYFVFSNSNVNDYYPSWSIENNINEGDTNRWGIQVAHLCHWLESIQRTLERSKIVKVPVAEGKKIRDCFRESTKLLSEIKISQST